MKNVCFQKHFASPEKIGNKSRPPRWPSEPIRFPILILHSLLSRTCCCSLKVVIGCLEAEGVHTSVFWFMFFFHRGFIYSSLKDPEQKQKNTKTNCDNISKLPPRGHIRSICCVWCSPCYDLKSVGDATRNPEKKHSTTRTPGHNKRDNPRRLQTNRSFLSSGLTTKSLTTARIFRTLSWKGFNNAWLDGLQHKHRIRWNMFFRNMFSWQHIEATNCKH